MLRAFAVMLVIYNHSILIDFNNQYTTSYQADFFELQYWTSIGLDLFFVISGLIMAIVTRSYFKNPTGWFNFSLKRFVRIVPLYWCYSVLVYIERHVIKHTVSHGQILKTLIFFPLFSAKNTTYPIIDQGWSLTYEMYFYMLIVAFLFFRLKNTIPVLLATMVILATAGYFIDPADLTLKFITTPILFEFSLGMAVGMAYHYITTHKNEVKHKVIRYTGIVATSVGLLLMFSSIFYDGQYISNPDFVTTNNIIALHRVLIWGVPCSIFVLGILFLEFNYKWVIPPILIKIGDASFSSYLVHILIIVAFVKCYNLLGFKNGDLFIIGATVLSIFISLPLYKYIEKPLLNYCNRLFFKSGKKSAT